jgi:hypothetical protein
VDADFAKGMHMKSTTGYVLTINDNPVMWKCKLQSSTSRSVAESELIAASSACSDVLHARRLLEEMGFPQDGRTLIFEDNQSVIDTVKNHNISNRMKHIDVCYFWIRSLQMKGHIEFVKVQSSKNCADLFTKCLSGKLFRRHCSKFFGDGMLLPGDILHGGGNTSVKSSVV